MEPPETGSESPAEPDPIWQRLLDELKWYSAKSSAAQHAYKRVKLAQIAVGAAVPVIALTSPAVITALVSAVIVVGEGAQQLYQWQANWLRYRATAESLKREQFLYLAAVGPYRDEDRHDVLAERVEAIISTETTAWSADRAQPDQKRD